MSVHANQWIVRSLPDSFRKVQELAVVGKFEPSIQEELRLIIKYSS
jgi:hypothetical protein